MNRLKPEVDVVFDILKAVAAAQPDNAFTRSILIQYQERGGLSKKQLEGLYGKARRVKEIPANKLATLEAIILRKHEKQKSEKPVNTPLYQKDMETGKLINAILQQYPHHKRVIFLKSKYDNNEPLSQPETDELKKFAKLLK